MVDYSNTRPDFRKDYPYARPNEGAIGFGVYLAAGLIVAVLLFALFGTAATDPGTYVAPDAINGSGQTTQTAPAIGE